MYLFIDIYIYKVWEYYIDLILYFQGGRLVARNECRHFSRSGPTSFDQIHPDSGNSTRVLCPTRTGCFQNQILPWILGVHNFQSSKSIGNNHGMQFFWVQHVGCGFKKAVKACGLWINLVVFCVYLGRLGDFAAMLHVLLAGTILFIIIHHKDPYPIGSMYASVCLHLVVFLW